MLYVKPNIETINMGTFKVQDPGGNVKWVKAIDTANGTIEFTDRESQAYYRSGDYFSKAEGEYIKFNFQKDHPELKNLVVILDGGREYRP